MLRGLITFVNKSEEDGEDDDDDDDDASLEESRDSNMARNKRMHIFTSVDELISIRTQRNVRKHMCTHRYYTTNSFTFR